MSSSLNLPLPVVKEIFLFSLEYFLKGGKEKFILKYFYSGLRTEWLPEKSVGGL